MFRVSLQVARVWGIPIKLHITLLIVVYLAISVFGWVGGLVFEALFATCIALHELGHSIVAIRKGCRVREITLLILGGVAQMESIPTRPLDEFLMALAGPAVSLLVGAGLLAFARFVDIPHIALKSPWELRSLIAFLGGANILLAVFNLLPAFPMDGGRVLRALLSSRIGRLRATLIASRVGQIVAVGFGLVGYFGVPGYVRPYNWLLVAVAFFIYTAAGNEYRAERIKSMLRAQGYACTSDEEPSTEPAGENEVVISPPPYEKGPASRTEIRPERRNPFDGLFGR